MKACPFCAEEIQEAAIVCRHCGRDLTAGASMTTAAAQPPKKRRWPWIVAAALIVGYFLIQSSRSDYLAFDRQREDWHRRCDVYIGRAVTAPDAIACKAELDEMTAYAKRKGWQ